jgi:hypothetical protein
MLILNIGGEAAWLTRPHGLKGLPKAKGQRLILDVTLLCRAYYRAGFDGISVEDAARQDIVKPGRDWQALVRTRQTLGLGATCEDWKAQGAADRAAGRNFSPPIASDYDQTALAPLLREMAAGRGE